MSLKECVGVVSNHFEVDVDWDIDVVFHEECHGTDWFFSDGSATIWFTLFTNGDIYASLPHGDGCLITSGGEGFKWCPCRESWGAMKSVPDLHAGFYGLFNSYLNKEFYKCYLESNNSLSEQQRQVVDQFFAGIERLFKNDYNK